ncbi:MAG TPA: glutamate 5-kinase [Pirellulales bacterium]|jgi:glutamate 5-kinase|nr:glutamate 5-kinase [Pirellulales bacterium]
MSDLIRQEIVLAAHTIVVKVGTRVLTKPNGVLDLERIAALADDLNYLLSAGKKVVLVSSGAVGAGLGQLSLANRPTDLAQLQAVAAVGQCHLMQAYDAALKKHRRHAAQILLTADDLDHRTKYLNIRNTLLALMEFGAVPIINENDTVSVDELQTTFGDNDRLAAMVTNLIRAPLLILLSDVIGLYDGDPADPKSEVLSTVTKLDEAIFALVRDQKTGLSKGGMASKLNAARIATTAGENVIITSGKTPDVLRRIALGEPVGTLFLAQGQTLSSFKRWLGYTVQTKGQLVVDDGAQRAVESGGRSLLAIGVVDVVGNFQKGDPIGLQTRAGTEFARGLTNYAAADVLKIKGLKTDAIAAALGHCPYDEVIHRDNLALSR